MKAGRRQGHLRARKGTKQGRGEKGGEWRGARAELMGKDSKGWAQRRAKEGKCLRWVVGREGAALAWYGEI